MSKNNQKNLCIAKPKENYQLKNWSDYNKSLKKRGSISIWLSDDVKDAWYYQGERKVGGSLTYSSVAIEFCLTLRHLLHLKYRQTEGFVEDLFSLLSLDLGVPCYTQICRRSATIEIDIKVTSGLGSIDLVIDSTGLKVYGDGEWKARKHGPSKRRTWRKLHMGSDGNSLEIYDVVLTENDKHDSHSGADIVNKVKTIKELNSVSGDGAYDKRIFRNSIPSNCKELIPPQEGAVENEDLPQRNEAIKRIKEIGKKEWKKEVGYHIRSKSEVNMYRYKTIFGDKLNAREPDYETTEIKIKCKILNKFVEIGMPNSYKKTA